MRLFVQSPTPLACFLVFSVGVSTDVFGKRGNGHAASGRKRQWGSHGGMYMPDYYWDQNNAVPVDYLCSQWFLRPEWLMYMWVSARNSVGEGL